MAGCMCATGLPAGYLANKLGYRLLGFVGSCLIGIGGLRCTQRWHAQLSGHLACPDDCHALVTAQD